MMSILKSGCAAVLIIAGTTLGSGAETNPAPTTSTSAAARPSHWAVKLTRPGLPNLYQVTTNLYRGAQPTAEGMTQLKVLGVKTVFNLRMFHSDTDELRGAGLLAARTRMQPWHSDHDDVIAFLKVVADTNNLPVFVHCQRGADRTGLMCAMYRIVYCGWTKAEAIDELKNGGFGYNRAWGNIVRYIERADIDKIRREVGLTENKVLSVPLSHDGAPPG